MKHLCILALMIFLPFLVHAQEQAEVKRLSEPVVSTPEFEEFGEEMGEPGASMALPEALDLFRSGQQKEFTIEGRIAEVCQHSGCWLIISEGELTVRVRTKDHEYYVPTDSADKRVLVRGVMEKVELSLDEAKHMADDAKPGSGEQVTEGHTEYTLMASTIRIYK